MGERVSHPASALALLRKERLMNREIKEKSAKGLKTVLGFTRIFILNTWRRTLILGRRLIICYHAQRQRRALRQLGYQVFQSLKKGEVNPMLTEGVKDAVNKAQAIDEVKERHYQAVAGLREKIATARAGEVPEAAAEKPPEESGS